jgi:hypothetical protein
MAARLDYWTFVRHGLFDSRLPKLIFLMAQAKNASDPCNCLRFASIVPFGSDVGLLGKKRYLD